MKTHDEPTYWARIFIAGDLKEIESVCQSYCDEVGYCVTVEPANYVYTLGAERGAVVGLINYPRFPRDPDAIFAHAEALGLRIMEQCGQKSFSIMTPTVTRWYNNRPEAQQ